MAWLKSATAPFSTTYAKSWTKLRANERKKLLGVLWAYETTKCVPIEETPFSLAYETEAIISVNISMPIFRVEGAVPDQNNIQLSLMLDHLEEKRQHAQIYIAAYQQSIQAAHHKKVKPKEFLVGDLVLMRVIQSTRQKDNGKLEPYWEGPYIIIDAEAMGPTPNRSGQESTQ